MKQSRVATSTPEEAKKKKHNYRRDALKVHTKTSNAPVRERRKTTLETKTLADNKDSIEEGREDSYAISKKKEEQRRLTLNKHANTAITTKHRASAYQQHKSKQDVPLAE